MCTSSTALLLVWASLFAMSIMTHKPLFVRIRAVHFVHWFFTPHSRTAYGIAKRRACWNSGSGVLEILQEPGSLGSTVALLLNHLHPTERVSSCCSVACCSVTKSCLTLLLHVLQHIRLPCLPLSSEVCSNSGPLSQWCYLNIQFSCLPSIFHSIKIVSNKSALPIGWPKYRNIRFSNKPSNE